VGEAQDAQPVLGRGEHLEDVQAQEEVAGSRRDLLEHRLGPRDVHQHRGEGRAEAGRLHLPPAPLEGRARHVHAEIGGGARRELHGVHAAAAAPLEHAAERAAGFQPGVAREAVEELELRPPERLPPLVVGEHARAAPVGVLRQDLLPGVRPVGLCVAGQARLGLRQAQRLPHQDLDLARAAPDLSERPCEQRRRRGSTRGHRLPVPPAGATPASAARRAASASATKRVNGVWFG
jgi:hypothetical protein